MLNILHLFVLVSFLFYVKCDLEQLFQTCCALGTSKGTDGLKCDKKIRTPIPGIPAEHQGICLSTIDICCVQFLREIACENGKQVAKQRKNCNIQPKTDDDVNFKYCCEACKLGLISSSMSMDCKMKKFQFNNPWDNAYESCCSELFPPINVTHVPDPNPNPININICDQYPGELCTDICIPEKNSFKCGCRPGSVLMADGKTCKQEVQEDRCKKFNICDQNCFDNGDSFVCSCNPGYELLADGRTCVDINECNLKLDKCDREGKICRNTIGWFECIDDPRGNRVPVKKPVNPPIGSCSIGYKFDRNSNACVDIDECLEAYPCKSSENCFNLQGSFRCVLKTTPAPVPTSIPISCGNGFVYNTQKNRCVDLNECDANPCEENEICENLHGSFQCKCKTGFQSNMSTGGACVDVNECQLNQHTCESFQRCDNTVGSYQCVRVSSCGTGYTLNSETNVCEDDDECLLGTDNCRLLGIGWECRNIAGSFRCVKKKTCDYGSTNCSKVASSTPECPKGYQYEKGGCVDIDECQSKNVCPVDQNCLNTPGSFRCVSEIICSPGLRQNDFQYCADIDECLEQPGLCDHKCINVWGSFRCSCNAGYLLHSDNRSCIDINECELFKNRRICLGLCINTPGSYKCQCPEGYKLSPDGINCEDINECAENRCSNANDVCVNIRGSFRCNTLTCPINYIQDPSRKNRCMRVGNFCILNPKACLQSPLFYSYNYMAFPSNIVMPASGQHAFFYMKGVSSQTTTTDQTWELSNVSAPYGVEKVTRDYFRMNHDSANEITLFLVKPIQGPQEIELLIRTSYSTNGIFSGFSLTKLFIYVSQYDF